ncbi:MAG: hypothetical protein HYR96_08775 [Deltaproteobacteria bacterium]|nr:hypothetical protein [Deltaproteobacteria bacterium]MBI3294929.1 hypothetical protein [Deltaproteobacteria bacterium]
MKNIAVLSILTMALSHAHASGPKVCAAVRGNGQWIFTHFAALARLTENYGLMEAMAGGSSGSITTFFYESMLLNKAVTGTPRERALKVAFLLKSLEEYLDVVRNSPEGLAIEGLAGFAKLLKEKKIDEMIMGRKFSEAADALDTLFESKDLRSIANRNLVKAVRAGRTNELVQMLAGFGAFKAGDKSIFFRPGFVDFDKVPALLGKVADFYAGRGPGEQRAKMARLLNRCATPAISEGELWVEIKDRTPECVSGIRTLIVAYRDSYDPNGNFDHRLFDKIGAKLRSFISTSILKGADLVNQFKDQQERYLADPMHELSFNIDFDRVKFGYWGRPADLIDVEKNFKNTFDAKSHKFLPLGPRDSNKIEETEWMEALRTSPAEPGLSAIQPINDELLSAGGWSDLHPVMVLKAVGCENVAYITRHDPESDFAIGVAKQLGMTDEEENALYTLGNQPGRDISSFQRSLNMADGIWCTEWDKFGGFEIPDMVRNAYRTPLITESPFFEAPRGTRPPRLVKHSQKVGCSMTQ